MDAASRSTKPVSPRQTGGFDRNPFLCNVCNRSYSRIDHLRRHYRSHTGEKPFACQYCDKAFSRLELLNRHAAKHPEEGARPPPKKTRAKKACDACAAAKLRCGDTRPCKRCIDKSLVCEASEVRPLVRERLIVEARSQAADDTGEDDFTSTGLTPYPIESSAVEATRVVQDQSPSMVTPVSVASSTVRSTSLSPGQRPLDVDVQADVFDLTIGNNSQRRLGEAIGNFFGTTSPDDYTLGLAEAATFADILKITNSHNAKDRAKVIPAGEVTSTTKNDASAQQRDVTQAIQHDSPSSARMREAMEIGKRAWKNLMWLPDEDDRGRRESAHWLGALPLSPAIIDVTSPGSTHSDKQAVSWRDQILAIILQTCDRKLQRHIVTHFPPTATFSTTLESFSAHHSHGVSSFVHLPSLDQDTMLPELKLALSCYGAAYSTQSEIRQLGYALLDIAAEAIREMFENDNTLIRELQSLQAFGLQLHVGRWSGVAREIEAAERLTMPFVTMLRRGREFRKESPSAKESVETNESLYDKWCDWAERESFRRLAFHALYADTCWSMSTLGQPIVRASEVQLELPYAQMLWQATSATEWKSACDTLPLDHDGNVSLPTYHACVADVSVLVQHQSVVDVQLSLILILCSHWQDCWRWRQMKAMAENDKNTRSTLALTFYHEEIASQCRKMYLSGPDLAGGIGCIASSMLELCQMHLYVSLEDLHLLAGSDGIDGVSTRLSALQAWATSGEARRAIYHAARVLRAAALHPAGTLRDFAATAVYHSTLCLWAYSVLRSDQSIMPPSRPGSARSTTDVSLLLLDGDNAPEVEQFVLRGAGIPCITSRVETFQSSSYVLMTDHNGITESALALLSCNNRMTRSTPQTVANLSAMISSLKEVAHAMLRA